MDEPTDNAIAGIRTWADRLIEASWLTVLLLVPLAFSPPGWFAFFETPKIAIARGAAGAIVILWAIDLALLSWRGRAPSPSGAWRSFTVWVRVEPLRWTVVATAAYLLWVVASTLASAVPRIAFWGFEYGRDGQSLYSVASVTVIFFAISLRLRRQAQIWRLVASLLVSATLVALYALLQSQQLDPFDLSRVRPGRVIGTLRNPIFLAAFLVPLLPLALAASLLLWRRSGRLAVGLTATMAPALILLVIALTLARGPWAGSATAVIVLAVLVTLLTGSATRIRGLVVLLAAFVLAGAALAVTPTPTGEDSIDATIGRLGSFSGEVQGDVSKRRTIWATSFELLAERPWFEFDDGATPVLRHLFGYGPDTFVYVYSLEAEPSSDPAIRLVKDGHNLWLHNAVEIGVIGALLLLAAYAIPVLMGAYLLLFRYRDWPVAYRVLAAALVAGIAGRGVEQLAGVAQTSDSLLAWALIALLVALPSASGASPRPEPAQAPSQPRAVAGMAVLLVSMAVVAATASLTWVHTNDNLRGARDAALSVTASRDERDLVRAVELVNSAIGHAPAVAAYRIRAAALFENVRFTNDDVDDQALTEGAVTVLRDGLAHNRLSFLLNVNKGEALLRLARQGNLDVVEEAARAFEKGAAFFPNVRDPNWAAGRRLLELGLPDRAMRWARRALELSTDDAQRADALFLVGVAFRDSGLTADAIDTFEQAIALDPEGPLAPTMRFILDALDDPSST